MKIRRNRLYDLLLVSVAGFSYLSGGRLLADGNVAAINASLATLDQQIDEGAFNDATRTLSKVRMMIFAEIKANPPASFEPSGVKVPSGSTVPLLLSQTAAIRQALQKPDLILARDLAMQFSCDKVMAASAVPPSAQLSALESESAGKTGLARFVLLPKLAKAAFNSGDFAKASSYSSEALSDSATYRKLWQVGDAVFYANVIQGRVMLAQNDLAGASSHLLAAGLTTGSPVLDSFGPNMALAHDLLLRGERQTVVQYLSECAKFWKSENGRISLWTAAINQGQVPDFGPNLLY